MVERFHHDSALLFFNQPKGKQTMKLTKNELNEKRLALCKVLVEINKRKAKVEALKKDLADDFEKNETAYRGGIPTAAGVLYRKPRWDVTAKENVVIED